MPNYLVQTRHTGRGVIGGIPSARGLEGHFLVLTLGIEIFGAALFGAKLFGADKTHWQGCNWWIPLARGFERTLLSFDIRH